MELSIALETKPCDLEVCTVYSYLVCLSIAQNHMPHPHCSKFHLHLTRVVLILRIGRSDGGRGGVDGHGALFFPLLVLGLLHDHDALGGGGSGGHPQQMGRFRNCARKPMTLTAFIVGGGGGGHGPPAGGGGSGVALQLRHLNFLNGYFRVTRPITFLGDLSPSSLRVR